MGQLSARIDAALAARGGDLALVAGDTRWSGVELRARALELAAALRARGVETGDTVAVLVDRSADSVVAILAVLMSGCAYLPLEPDVPSKWLRHLLALAQPQIVVFSHVARSVATELATVPPLGILSANARVDASAHDGASRCACQDESLAYVMGTSGTTGLPKAVPIRVSSLLHYCDGFAARVGGHGVLAGMRMASVTTLAADLGNTMVFPSLLFGGELHIVPRHLGRDPQRFAAYVQDHEIDALKVVPTHLRALLDHGGSVLPRRLLVVGGEPFGLDLLARLEACAPACNVFNHYGPTEATVGVAMHSVATAPGTGEGLRALGHRTVPIGTALGDNQLRVVDERGEPCDQGCLGELIIGGPSVSNGYLGSPDPSARFVEAAWSLVGRVYRTGDFARVSPTGDIELFGRMDRQFKIRGHRVEAGGVEEALRAHPGILDAFVEYRERSVLGATLFAWVHARDEIDEISLRTFLADRLPAPMVPSRIIVVDMLPRTANGKVDAAALPEPRTVIPETGPRSVEDAVARVFARVLAVPVEQASDDFFRLGGHSLTALQVIARLREDYGFNIGVESFYANPTPAGIARAVRPAAGRTHASAAGKRASQISPQVLALWTHLRLSPRDRVYEVPVRLRVLGPVTRERVRAALADLAIRHEALRTRFEERDGQPVPVVDADASTTMRLVADISPDTQATGLDIEHGPLVCGSVTSVGPDECLIDLLVHHIAYDGTSGAVLVRELAALLGGEALMPVQHSSDRTYASGQEPRPFGDGARARFGLSPTRLMSDGPRRCHELPLSAALWGRVEACATALSTTPFVVAAAAWALVLSRQDGEPVVTIGTPADLRDPSNEDRLVGYHTNLAVIETEIRPEDTISEFVRRTHHAVGRALADRHRPYANLVADQRTVTGTSPTRTLLAIERLERANGPVVEILQERVLEARPVFDIDLVVVVADETATIQIHQRVEACPEGRARCLGEQLTHVLAQFVVGPTLPAADVSILPDAWAERVMQWSRGPVAPVSEAWNSMPVRGSTAVDPDATALVWPGGGRWSRAQFAEAVAQSSQALRASGLGPGHVVAVAVPQSPALAVAFHAAHAIGAAVLSLDPVWPEHRLEAAARQAQANVRITTRDGVTVCVEGVAASKAPHSSDLAYVILTSGSTGAPKLVAVQHGALANELSWFSSTFPMDEHDRVLAHSSPGFDVAVWEMLGPLSWGACLVFPAIDRRNDVPHLAEVIRDQSVTIIQAVPSLLEGLVGELASAGLRLRLLVSGGEEMPPSLPSAVAERLPKAVLVNTYGPSETAIDVVFHRIDGPITPGRRVPLGRPITGACTYIVDDRLRLMPPGAFGQLAIAGNPVGRGYLGDPAETARRFVTNPFASRPGDRMYLTGDRARWDEHGVLEFGGRQDHQVKVRGNRVELEAVEAALRSLPMVHDAVVHLQDAGTMRARLVALVVPSEHETLSVNDLYEQSARRLPSYMVPSAFGIVPALPRLSNGKIARDALPLEALQASVSTAEWRTEMESNVARVWMDVLCRQDLVSNLPFFASGGTSLLIPVLHFRLQKALGVTLSVPELFEHTTIGAQAAALEQRAAGVAEATPLGRGRGKMRRDAYAAGSRRRSV